MSPRCDALEYRKCPRCEILTDPETTMDESQPSRILLIVPKALVKTVKDALEAHGKLDKTAKIKLISSNQDLYELAAEKSLQGHRGSFLISTTICSNISSSDTATVNSSLLEEIGMQHHEADIRFITRPIPKSNHALDQTLYHRQNLLSQAISTWLHTLPLPLSPIMINDLLATSRWSYTLYPPLLLLPPTTFSSPPWPSLITTTLSRHLPKLYSLICTTLKVTHIALNAPIPALTLSSTTANIFRAPTSLSPLHGDFGPILPADRSPSATDMKRAFWCSAQQNRIHQTWAPRYTMFSRGNISEKRRILELRSLTREGLRSEPGKTSAVDLYAGIGYFAFSYVAAGVGSVICWEINPWSVEGLARGAERNGWGVTFDEVARSMEKEMCVATRRQKRVAEERLVVFQEDNKKAAERIAAMRGTIPTIRHVNCGFLPTSQGSWETAVQVLDPVEGGWIHAHENIGIKEIETRKKEIVAYFTALAYKHRGDESERRVVCDHLERVKDYAPGVLHCVLDIAIMPRAAMPEPQD